MATDPQIYRERAARCVELATRAETDDIKQRYLSLSQSYETMALEAERDPESDQTLKLLKQTER